MNILFTAESYPSPKHPVTAFIQVLCRELVRQGHEVTVIAPQALIFVLKHPNQRRPFHFQDIWEENGEKYVIDIYSPYSISSGFGKLAKLTIKSSAFAVNFMANRMSRPDICYAHMWTSAYYISKYSRSHNIPLFVASGEDRILLHKYLSEKDILKFRSSLSGLIAVSTKNLEESHECGFIVESKSIVLPNAIDNKKFTLLDREILRKKFGLTSKDFVVAFVGRFYKRKGVDKVAEAISALDDEDIKSIFIGTSNPGENIDPNCKGIIFKGKLPHDEIPIYLNVADIFVLPSLAEGCSNAIIEAMACGKPIISSNLPFNYDILDATNSILIDPNRVEEIANAISLLHKDIELRTQLSLGSINKVKELTIENRTKKIVSFIKDHI